MDILDIHAHKTSNKRKDTIYNLVHPEFNSDNLNYSLGIHPWYIPNNIDWTDFKTKAAKENIKAIGEIGVDKLYSDCSLDRQIEVFSRQIEISEQLAKPVIIHMVKSLDIILEIKQQLKPQQPWIIHGFRGKPEQAKQLIKHNIHFSVGEKYNVNSIDINRLLVETDESSLSIEEIIKKLSEDLNINEQQLITTIKSNVNAIFF